MGENSIAVTTTTTIIIIIIIIIMHVNRCSNLRREKCD